MADPAQTVGANLMEEWDTVVAAERLAITRIRRDMSSGLPGGKMIMEEIPQVIPEIRAKIR
jgi:hypothetical protein